MNERPTHSGARFLRVARTLTLVSGLVGCGASVEPAATDAATDSQSAYDGEAKGLTLPDSGMPDDYVGFEAGTSPAPYDGGEMGTVDAVADTGEEIADSPSDTYVGFEVGTSAPPSDAGEDGAEVGIGGPLVAPDFPA